MFNPGDKVKILLGSDKSARVIGWADDTRGQSIRIKFEDSDHDMLVDHGEILLANDPEWARTKGLYQSLKQKGFNHIALIRKSNDPKIYHKAMKHTQEYFVIKKQCEEKSTSDVKYSIVKVM